MTTALNLFNCCSEMKRCEINDSTHVAVEENLMYKLYLSLIERKWTSSETEVLPIESYCSSSGSYFSVIYGFVEKGTINRISVHCDRKASLEDAKQFAAVVFREEIVDKIKNMSTIVLHIQPEILLLPVLEKFNDVTDSCFGNWDKYNLSFPPASLSLGTVPELPVGYSFGLLHDTQHVKFVADIWAQDLGLAPSSSKRFEKSVELNIKRPHVAVFYQGNELPVGWILVYADGGIGQLHVVKNHRRKGLGRVLVRKVTQLVKEAHGIGPNVMINAQNDISANLFLSEGWARTPRNYKFIVSKKLMVR